MTPLHDEGIFTMRVEEVDIVASYSGHVGVKLRLDGSDGPLFAVVGPLNYVALSTHEFGEFYHIPQGPQWLMNRWVKVQVKRDVRVIPTQPDEDQCLGATTVIRNEVRVLEVQ